MGERVETSFDGGAGARRALERTIAGGGVVVFPADGLYGLACDPLSEPAIARIQALKGREDGKPSAVMYFDRLAMRELLPALGERTREALAALLPGPATCVVQNPGRRYPLACRADPEQLGLRLIEGPLAGAGCPVFQTSANLSGEPAPARLAEVPAPILQGADLVIDGGELPGVASTVIDLTRFDRSGEWRILRHGAMAGEEIASELERVVDPGGSRSSLG